MTILQVMQTALELSVLQKEKRGLFPVLNKTRLNLCCLSGTQQSANKSHYGKRKFRNENTERGVTAESLIEIAK